MMRYQLRYIRMLRGFLELFALLGLVFVTSSVREELYYIHRDRIKSGVPSDPRKPVTSGFR
ncbi:hypothetical protein [Actinosynnema sp. NPDC020468]|uniref:hypothetical protein n=1 Tax=Actinosynnema sp. NPDC020468 TaxID=3154488 RepID=UPI0033CDFBBA